MTPKPPTIPTDWQKVFLLAKERVNLDRLPQRPWPWPKSTWFQSRRALLAKREAERN